MSHKVKDVVCGMEIAINLKRTLRNMSIKIQTAAADTAMTNTGINITAAMDAAAIKRSDFSAKEGPYEHVRGPKTNTAIYVRHMAFQQLLRQPCRKKDSGFARNQKSCGQSGERPGLCGV